MHNGYSKATFVMTLAAVWRVSKRLSINVCALTQATQHLAQHSSNAQRTAENGYPKVYAAGLWSDVPPAQKMGDVSGSLVERARPHEARLSIRSVHATEVFCRPRSAPVATSVARTPINFFNSHRVGDDYHRRWCQLAECRENVGPGRACTYRVLKQNMVS